MSYIDYPKAYNGMEGNDNVSGLKQKLWLAPIGWFTPVTGIKGLKTVKVADGDLVTINGTHTFQSGKGFIEMYTTYNTGQLSMAAQENPDQNGSEVTIEAFYPGNSKPTAELFRFAKNDVFIVLAEDMNVNPDTNAPYIYQIGTNNLYAFLSTEFKTNNLKGDRKGYMMKFKSFSVSPMYYEGVITLKP